MIVILQAVGGAAVVLHYSYREGLVMVCTMLYLVSVPETDSATKWQLPHQQIVHPSESKLQVLNLILLEMIVNVLWTDTHRKVNM